MILPTYNAIIDGTDFTDKVIISFAVKETVVASLETKITEMSGGRDKLEAIGERFDFR